MSKLNQRFHTYSSSIKSQSIEADESGSKALTLFKDMLKKYTLDEIQITNTLPKKPKIEIKPKRSKRENINYRIASKSTSQINIDHKFNITEATLYDVPIVRIFKSKSVYDPQDCSFSTLMIQKYYQQTLRYDKRQQMLKLKNTLVVKEPTQTPITKGNFAIRNFKRKLKTSRRDQIDKIIRYSSI
ncbi:hypothetical protein pb186bvf_019545 [Paramecium bursaria]